MSVKAGGRQVLDQVTKRFGYRVVAEARLDDWQIPGSDWFRDVLPTVNPEGAEAYLRQDNPRLEELSRLYAQADLEVRAALLWTEERVGRLDLLHFRRETPSIGYVAVLGVRNLDSAAYALTTYYTLATDRLELLDRLREDTAFGGVAFDIAGRTVSRDLLDSIQEINFLDRHLSVASRSDLKILDIGAGYGRLAHRLLTACPALPLYLCTDAVAASSFVCEYYLRHRGLEGKAVIVPPMAVDAELERHHVELAVNIHSFSECIPAAVAWWLRLLARRRVKYIMLVPNPNRHQGKRLFNGQGVDLLPLFGENGYRVVACEPKYGDAMVQQTAIVPNHYWLFQLGNGTC